MRRRISAGAFTLICWMASAGVADATPPKLLSQSDIQAIAANSDDWNSRKSFCDGNLNDIIQSGYVGFDWHDAVINYSTCYRVAKVLGLSAPVVQSYSDKTLALMRVLARDQAYGTPATSQELLAVGDGATKTFALRMPPAAGSTVKVYLAPLTQKSFTYSGATIQICDSECFSPFVAISDTAGGAAHYVRSVDYHEGYPNQLRWLNGNHPASGATFFAKIADQDFTTVSSGSVTVSGGMLTLATAPTANQAVFVEYMGPAYAQTGNAMGGVEAVRPDSYFPMRSMNVALAWAFDALRDSTALTADLRSEYSKLLADQVDAYMEVTGMNPYLDTPLSNYFIEGELTGGLCTAFAVDDDVTTTAHGRVLKDLARSLINMAAGALDTNIPGGYGFEGTYTNGSVNDLLNVFTIWKAATTEDLAAQLEWTQNLIPATIHGIKPDRQTFYDGGDWNDLPATPLTTVLQAFVQYQSDHPMAPFARQALIDIGESASGPTKDYKSGADAFPLSFVTKGTGALYARSDWGTGAVWLSMSVGPVFSLGHEHLDRGHVTIQRGADYLLKDSGDYGAYDTIPWHNTVGFGNGNTPSECGGDDDGNVKPPKVIDGGEFVYGQEDMTKSFCNGVAAAVRTLVYVRPNVILVHDQLQTTDANTKKQFNLNFANAIAQSGDVYSTTAGASKLFVRAMVPANPTAVIIASGTSITGANGAFKLKGTNWRVSTSGHTADTFLHLFQATDSGQAQMAASAYLQSADARAEGAAVDLGSKRWVMLSSTAGGPLGGTLAYALPVTCPCAHVVGDLQPTTNYQALVYNDAGGAPIQTLSLATGPEGVLSFETADAAAKQVTLVAGDVVADTTPPTVSLSAPAGGSTVSGVLTVRATAADTGTGVTKVQFFVDGAQVGEDGSSPYTDALDTRNLTNGTHMFSAKAFDGAGHSTTSAVVSATVSNTAEPSDSTPPAAPTMLRVE